MKNILMKSPRIISAVILRKDEKVMLIKEVLEDKKEHWIFPGGGVEFGETIEEAHKLDTELGLVKDSPWREVEENA